MENKVILCVDDERIALNGLKAQLGRSLGPEFTIELAESGEEALELFNELLAAGTDIPVVISDQLMPGLKGHELLKRVYEVSPGTHTVLLTGQSSLEAVTEAVNHANLYRYITKPWESHDLLMTVKEAIKSFYQDRQLKEQNRLLDRHNNELELLVKERTKQLQDEKQKAERAGQLKHKFMANMSHEIRTPMNAIVGMTRLMLSKDPKPEHLRYLNAMRMSADNLLVIINDILDFSKIESGKIMLEKIDFNVRDVLRGISDMLYTKVEEKGLKLTIETDPSIPRIIKGDPTKLNQVLVNLAGNAIKFTEIGQVTISAVLLKSDHKQLSISFDVRDTGIGIAPEHMSGVFESFTQAGSDITRKFGGTGLGLSISKQLTNLMGGDIFICSELGKGSTFSAVMSFDIAEQLSDDKKPDELDDQLVEHLKKMKILLVEDNEFNRMVAEDTLNDLVPGIDIQVAVNGYDAVERLKSELFDIVLMDIHMPVMDGFAATKEIRTNLTGPARNVKIIAMTANVLQEEVKEYYAIGMDGYVSKPFVPKDLLMKMSEVVSDINPAREDHGATADTTENILLSAVTDFSFIKKFTNDNPEKIRKYLSLFLENAPALLTELELGLTAKDHKAMKIAAHSLKPQLSYMGVREELSQIAYIESACDKETDFEIMKPFIGNLKLVCSRAFKELIKNI